MTSKTDIHVRPLSPDDLGSVVSIDRKHSGSTRTAFYEKRLQAALRNPKKFVYVGACRGDTLVGFALARLEGGEFGRETSVAALDAIGVDPDHAGYGVARALMAELDSVLSHKGTREMGTQADWTDHDLLRFFAASGFRHAPRIVLERVVSPFDD